MLRLLRGRIARVRRICGRKLGFSEGARGDGAVQMCKESRSSVTAVGEEEAVQMCKESGSSRNGQDHNSKRKEHW